MRLALLLLLSAPAAAEDANRVGFGVNAPVQWPDGKAFGASAYVALGSPHHALRANVASYAYTSPWYAFLAQSEGDYDGRVRDYGLAYTHFGERFLDGFTFEVGALVRDRDTSHRGIDHVATESRTYALRAMIGWSWTIKHAAFVSFTTGISTGIETGTQTTTPELEMPSAVGVNDNTFELEGILRFGFLVGH